MRLTHWQAPPANRRYQKFTPLCYVTVMLQYTITWIQLPLDQALKSISLVLALLSCLDDPDSFISLVCALCLFTENKRYVFNFSLVIIRIKVCKRELCLLEHPNFCLWNHSTHPRSCTFLVFVWPSFLHLYFFPFYSFIHSFFHDTKI